MTGFFILGGIMKVGKYDIKLLNIGPLYLDGGAMYGVVPKTLWEPVSIPDDKNRIELAQKSLLLISDDKIILLDTGSGNKYSQKVKNIYKLEDSHELLRAELFKHNITFNDITDVILTHLHFDHCGGSTVIENSELKITFPNANFYLQKSQYEWAKNPSLRDRSAYNTDNFLPIAEEGNLFLLDGDAEIFSNISVYKVNGHTYGMQLIGVFDDNIRILHAADLIPLASHVNLNYIMSYDLLPMITLEEKKLFLKECVENDVLIFLEHEPGCDLIRIDKNESGYFIKERLKWDEVI